MIKINRMEIQSEKFLKALEGKKKSVNTIRNYKCDLNILNTYLKSVKVTDLTKVDLEVLEGFIASQASNSASTINRRIVSTRTFFQYLKKHKIVTYNTAIDMEMLTLPVRRKPSLTLEQSRDLVKVVSAEEGSKRSVRDMAVVSTLLNTGLRVAELVGINWSDVDFECKVLNVIGKGDKERTIPLNDAIIGILDNYKQGLDIKKDCKVFPVTSKTIENIISKYVAKTGLSKEITPHKFRRSFATILYNMGTVDIYTLSQLLGHVSIDTTKIYIAECESKKKEAVASMPSFI